jgi:hypothetical protein
MRYALVYGLISGTIIILTMIAGFELAAPDSFTHTLWYGYLLMFVVLAFVFVGVKRYRDVECGGVVRFWRALAVGLGMAAFAGLAYLVIFEIYLAATDYGYLHAAVAKADTAAGRDQLESMLFNPVTRVIFVFLEISSRPESWSRWSRPCCCAIRGCFRRTASGRLRQKSLRDCCAGRGGCLTAER